MKARTKNGRPAVWARIDARDIGVGDTIRVLDHEYHVREVRRSNGGWWEIKYMSSHGSVAVHTSDAVERLTNLVKGLPMTLRVGSDLYPGKVLSWTPGGKRITVDVGQGPEDLTLRAGGRYRRKGDASGGAYFGKADRYRDPSV